MAPYLDFATSRVQPNLLMQTVGRFAPAADQPHRYAGNGAN